MRGGLSRCALLVVLPAAAAACTHRPLTVSAPVADGGEVDAAIDAAPADARDGGDATAPRVPRKHRAAGQACPHERGPSTLTADQLAQCTSSPSLSQLVDCRGDADCTAGTNGECVLRPAPFACLIDCSYDQCFDDSGCASPAPCSCRASGASPDANHCLTGSECRVDADCGPGGFCSPSLPDQILCVCPSPALCPPGSTRCTAGGMEVPCACGDACGHGYFCHTKEDACVDDEDCAGMGACGYDRVAHHWRCVSCLPIP